jgi:hypothetical protein
MFAAEAYRMKRVLIGTCVLLLMMGCVPEPAAIQDEAPVTTGVQAQTPLPSSAKVMFLHHSTGDCVWSGGVPAWLAQQNADHGTSYAIDKLAFPNTPYAWENYPYDYWNIWVSNAGSAAYQAQPTLEMLCSQYEVIVLKHCFPVSGIGPDTGSPNIASSSKTIENYTLQYNALKAKMRSFPSNRFIVWTGAALIEGATNPIQAARAKQFFDWVKTTWDEPGDNVYVWDFWSLETDGGLYLTPAHATGDSHPNAGFSAEVAPLFGARVVDVIEGRGDTGSITGI